MTTHDIKSDKDKGETKKAMKKLDEKVIAAVSCMGPDALVDQLKEEMAEKAPRTWIGFVNCNIKVYSGSRPDTKNSFGAGQGERMNTKSRD